MMNAVLLLCCICFAWALPCMQNNVTLTSSKAVDSTCTTIVYRGVTVNAGLTLTVPISTLTLNTTVQQISISFDSFVLLAGARITFDSSHIDTADRIPVTVAVSNLAATDGGLLFIGRFPAVSSVLLSNSSMTVSDSGISFGSPGEKAIVLQSVLLTASSVFAIRNVSLNATVGSTGKKYLVYANISLQNQSTLSLSSVSMELGNGDGALVYIDGNTSISGWSSFYMTSCILSASSSGNGVYFSANVAVSNSSQLALVSTKFSNVQAVVTVSSAFLLELNSSFSFRSCVVTSASSLFVSLGSFYLRTASRWLLVDTTADCSTTAVQVPSEFVMIESGATFGVDRCNSINAGSDAFYFGSSSMSISGTGTAWFMTNSTIASTASGAAIYFYSLRLSGNASVTISSTSLSSLVSSPIVMQSLLQVSDFAVFLIANSSLVSSSVSVDAGLSLVLGMTVSNWSSFSVRDSIITSQTDCISLLSIDLSNHSAMTIVNTTMKSVAGSIVYCSSGVTLSSHCTFLISGSTLGPCYDDVLILGSPATLLLDYSTFLINSSTLVATPPPSSTFGNTITMDTLTVDGRSTWTVRGTSLAALATGIQATNIVVKNGSVWELSGSNFNSSGTAVMINSVTTVSGGSAFMIGNTTLFGVLQSVQLGGQITVSNSSAFSFAGVNISCSDASCNGLNMASSVAVDGGSAMTFADSQLGAVQLAMYPGNGISVTNGSAWSVQRSSVVSSASNCFYFDTALTVVGGSSWSVVSSFMASSAGCSCVTVRGTVTVPLGSSLSFTDTVLSSDQNYPLRFMFPVTVANGSWLLVRGNVMNTTALAASGKACVSFDANMTMGNGSVTSLLDNACTNAVNLLWFGWLANDTASTLYGRCNALNGAVSASGMPRSSTQLPCLECRHDADCLLPVAMPRNRKSLPCLVMCSSPSHSTSIVVSSTETASSSNDRRGSISRTVTLSVSRSTLSNTLSKRVTRSRTEGDMTRSSNISRGSKTILSFSSDSFSRTSTEDPCRFLSYAQTSVDMLSIVRASDFFI